MPVIGLILRGGKRHAILAVHRREQGVGCHMIDNLNSRSFAPYGLVYEEKTGVSGELDAALWSQEHSLSAGGKEQPFTCYPDTDIRVDYVDGMSALCILDEETGRVHAYYLDKLVCIRKGAPFALIALGEPGTVRWHCAQEAPRVIHTPPVEMPALILRPGLEITSLHTLFYQEKSKGFFFRGETHAPYELTYVDRGHMHCIVAGQHYALGPHDMLLCMPDQWHIQYADPDESASFLTVSFAMRCEGAESLGGRVHRATEAMIGCLEAMRAEQSMPSRWSVDRIFQQLAQVILSLLERQENGGAVMPEGSENYLVDQALRYMEGHLAAPLTVAKVAGHVCVSPSYLAVLFRRHLQMTPTAVIRKLKLEESRRLIRKGELTISQVSQHLGFATLQHFSRCFTAYFGLGPRAYAKSLR